MLLTITHGGAAGCFDGRQQSHALASDQFDDAVSLEQGVGLGDGHRVDLQFAGQLADGGQKVAGLKPAGGDQPADLVDQLPVDRHPGGGKNMEKFSVHVYYYINTLAGMPMQVNSLDLRSPVV